MTEKRFSVKKSGNGLFYRDGDYKIDNTIQFVVETVEMKLNQLFEENEQLKQQRKDLLRLIDNNIEIYENINTNVEFHKGEIQGKLTLLYNLRKVILND